jgi:hypothetical protein
MAAANPYAKDKDKPLDNLLIEFTATDGEVSQIFVDNATSASTVVTDPDSGEVVEFLLGTITTKVGPLIAISTAHAAMFVHPPPALARSSPLWFVFPQDEAGDFRIMELCAAMDDAGVHHHTYDAKVKAVGGLERRTRTPRLSDPPVLAFLVCACFAACALPRLLCRVCFAAYAVPRMLCRAA